MKFDLNASRETEPYKSEWDFTLLENMLSTSVIYDFQHRFFNRC